jgi:hypothetical protein
MAAVPLVAGRWLMAAVPLVPSSPSVWRPAYENGQ